MEPFREKYINPFTDFGFKRIFGQEPNKDLLIDFLNELLREEQGEIKELTYLKGESLPESADERKVVFDLYCTNEKGERFIVEMQKTRQLFFKDRALYYSTFPIREQVVKGKDWNFMLRKVYTIAILDFVFDQQRNDPEKMRYNVKLTDVDTHEVFYDKFMFIFLEMPKFNKSIVQLANRYEKWLFILKNLPMLDRLPEELREGIFEKLFKTAEIAKFNPQEQMEYQNNLKQYRDLKNALDTAREEGLEKGLEKGERKKQEAIARKMKSDGMPIDVIAKYTDLTREEIEKL
ncbi:MAG: Rpn family recombination-promoting nuclease/putative transposase [Bacteroidales bacterium]